MQDIISHPTATPGGQISPLFGRDPDVDCKISERGIFSYDKVSRLLNIFHATCWLFYFILFHFRFHTHTHTDRPECSLSVWKTYTFFFLWEIIWRELFVHFFKREYFIHVTSLCVDILHYVTRLHYSSTYCRAYCFLQLPTPPSPAKRRNRVKTNFKVEFAYSPEACFHFSLV